MKRSSPWTRGAGRAWAGIPGLEVLVVGILALLGSSLCAATILVDIHGGGAFTAIQPAIDAAMAGDTILVSPGEYVTSEPIDFNRQTKPSSPVKNLTLQSTLGAGVTTIRLQGVDSSVVIFQTREDSRSLLAGFTITGGKGIYVASATWLCGGGIVCVNSSTPRIASCIIAGNQAFQGGGVYLDSPHMTLTDCDISGNTGILGAGLSVQSVSSDPLIALVNCRFAGNTGLDPQRTYSPGGGGLVGHNTSIRCTGCWFSANSAGEGAGVLLFASSARFIECGIVENSADRSAAAAGHDSTLTFDRCTISGNCQSEDGVISLSNSTATIASSIVWGNLGSPFQSDKAAPTVSTSCIEGTDVWPGAGNINSDPLFCGWGEAGEVWVDGGAPAGGDGSRQSPFQEVGPALRFGYSLALGSPCVRAVAGQNMGAVGDLCDAPGPASRLVHVGAGEYPIRGSSLVQNASLSGLGQDVSSVKGTIHGLRTGATLTGLKVMEGAEGGILVRCGQAPEIRECAIATNPDAGLVVNGSAPRVLDCSISGNRRAGVQCRGSSPELTGCRIEGNLVSGIRGEDSSPTITRCRIAGNFAAGVYLGGGAPALTDCEITANSSGGFYLYGGCRGTMSGCDINRNYSNSGGGLRCMMSSTVVLDGCKLEGNWGDQGGGLAVLDSTATLTACFISGNGSREGGGIHCQSDGTTALFGCHLEGNSAETEGGGAFVDATSSLASTNSEVIANRANRGAGASSPGGELNFMNCTISGNQADGTGIIWSSGRSLLTNCIVWGNDGTPLAGDIVAAHSCIQGMAAGEGNIDQDPVFLSPGKFDFTRTRTLEAGTHHVLPDFILQAGDYRLGPTSPAIDAATPEGAPAEDINGLGRPCGAGVDMGASEYCSPGFRRGDVNSDDEVNITDVLAILFSLFRADAGKPACEEAADLDDSGVVDISDPIRLLDYLFLGGQAPAQPFTRCGSDPTPDGIGCD